MKPCSTEKKHEIERLRKVAHDAHEAAYEERRSRIRLEEVNRSLEDKCEEMRKDHDEDLKTIAELTQERDHALALAADYSKMLDLTRETIKESLKKTEQDIAEAKELRDQLEKAREMSECPADCMHRKNPNKCRTCTRYPHAKDKYEVQE